jgi:hypothetical protein
MQLCSFFGSGQKLNPGSEFDRRAELAVLCEVTALSFRDIEAAETTIGALNSAEFYSNAIEMPPGCHFTKNHCPQLTINPVP